MGMAGDRPDQAHLRDKEVAGEWEAPAGGLAILRALGGDQDASWKKCPSSTRRAGSREPGAGGGAWRPHSGAWREGRPVQWE